MLYKLKQMFSYILYMFIYVHRAHKKGHISKQRCFRGVCVMCVISRRAPKGNSKGALSVHVFFFGLFLFFLSERQLRHWWFLTEQRDRGGEETLRSADCELIDRLRCLETAVVWVSNRGIGMKDCLTSSDIKRSTSG